CTAACTPRISLLADRRTARRYDLGARTVGRGGANRAFSGRRTLLVRFTREARRKLRSARRIRLTLVGVATDARGRRVTARRTVVLRTAASG
ncbi:MAG: hypothetical protein M3P50_05575, partial [Actinomycetota bacterium]|nr:hypothetical protein [Actinomycetota bacterium]